MEGRVVKSMISILENHQFHRSTQDLIDNLVKVETVIPGDHLAEHPLKQSS